MTSIIPKSLLLGMIIISLNYNEKIAKLEKQAPTSRSQHRWLAATRMGSCCNTTSRHTSSAIVYSNTVLEIPVAVRDVVTRVREIEIQFGCFYSKNGVISSVEWKPRNKSLCSAIKEKETLLYLWICVRTRGTWALILHEDWLPSSSGALQASLLWSVCHIRWQAAVNQSRSLLCHSYSGSKKFPEVRVH